MKLGFLLLSPRTNPIPSTRISVLNVLPSLASAGFETSIVHEPAAATETPDVTGVFETICEQHCSIVYFQKVRGRSVAALARRLRAAGIKTIYGVCDRVEPEMVNATDATVVVTDYLRRLYPTELQYKMHVVHDGIERPDVRKEYDLQSQPDQSRRLRAVLVTSARLDSLPAIGSLPDWLEVTIVGHYPPAISRREWLFAHCRRLRTARDTSRRLDYLRFHADRRLHLVQWQPSQVYDRMLAADVGIIPIDTTERPGVESDEPAPAWMVKSENRLTMKMCIGLPVVLTPIPSYEPVVIHGKNGFFAHTRSEWLESLNILRDPDVRARIGNAARVSVIERYSINEQAKRLVAVLHSVLGNNT